LYSTAFRYHRGKYVAARRCDMLLTSQMCFTSTFVRNSTLNYKLDVLYWNTISKTHKSVLHLSVTNRCNHDIGTEIFLMDMGNNSWPTKTNPWTVNFMKPVILLEIISHAMPLGQQPFKLKFKSKCLTICGTIWFKPRMKSHWCQQDNSWLICLLSIWGHVRNSRYIAWMLGWLANKELKYRWKNLVRPQISLLSKRSGRSSGVSLCKIGKLAKPYMCTTLILPDRTVFTFIIVIF
jgi:hypothetical protein